MGSNCVQTYVNDVGGHGYTEVAKDLDSAIDFVGCAWHTMFGNKLVAINPGGHENKNVPPKVTLTGSEKQTAEELANKVRKITKTGTGAEHLALADEVHSFAISVLHRLEEPQK